MTKNEIYKLSVNLLTFIDIFTDEEITDRERVDGAITMVEEILIDNPKCKEVVAQLEVGSEFLSEHGLD